MTNLAKTTAQLIRAYDQLADGNRVTSAEEFHAYGKRWNVDTHAMVDKARAELDARFGRRV